MQYLRKLQSNHVLWTWNANGFSSRPQRIRLLLTTILYLSRLPWSQQQGKYPHLQYVQLRVIAYCHWRAYNFVARFPSRDPPPKSLLRPTPSSRCLLRSSLVLTFARFLPTSSSYHLMPYSSTCIHTSYSKHLRMASLPCCPSNRPRETMKSAQ